METVIEILIDNSGSMGPYKDKKNNPIFLLPDGSTRMSLAKSVLLNELLPTVDYASKIIVRKFYSPGGGNNLENPILYEGNFDYETISQKITSIPDPENTGGTPITEAIKYSIKALSEYSENDRKIILVTDGEETGEGDYKKAAKEAIEHYGILCNIFIIGIALTPKGETKAKELAEETGGKCENLQAINYDKASLQNILRPLKSAVIATSTNHNLGHNNSQLTTANSLYTTEIKSDKQLPDLLPQNIGTLVSTPGPEEPTDENSIEKQLIISKQNKSDNENLSEIPDNMMDNFINQIDQNTTAIKLLSKQLGLISEEIKNLKSNKEDEDNDVEPVFKENPELNEKIRLASESFLFEKLKQKFEDRVVWLNEQKESGNNHDFEVLDSLNGSIEYFIECKGSVHAEKIFYLTKNEWFFFLKNTKNYQLFFVANALNNPEIVQVDNFKDWLFEGKIVPFVSKNIVQKANRIVFSILE